jgi:ribosomal-protein-alanine N-acetyltransferase
MIETERLLLRPMRAGDLDDLLLIFSDPKVAAAFSIEPFGRPEMQGWLDRNLKHREQYGYGLFSVVHKAARCLIGNCGLEHMEVGGSHGAELGFDFRSDYWNRGLATEAASAVRNFAFDRLELSRVISLVRRGNAASQRVVEKIGMRHEADLSRNGIDYQLFSSSRDQRPQSP